MIGFNFPFQNLYVFALLRLSFSVLRIIFKESLRIQPLSSYFILHIIFPHRDGHSNSNIESTKLSRTFHIHRISEKVVDEYPSDFVSWRDVLSEELQNLHPQKKETAPSLLPSFFLFLLK